MFIKALSHCADASNTIVNSFNRFESVQMMKYAKRWISSMGIVPWWKILL